MYIYLKNITLVSGFPGVDDGNQRFDQWIYDANAFMYVCIIKYMYISLIYTMIIIITNKRPVYDRTDTYIIIIIN